MHFLHQTYAEMESYGNLSKERVNSCWETCRFAEAFLCGEIFTLGKQCRANAALGYRIGVLTICRRAAIRSSNGGCVLNNELSVPPPNIGFTMHNAAVLGAIAEVGIRLL